MICFQVIPFPQACLLIPQCPPCVPLAPGMHLPPSSVSAHLHVGEPHPLPVAAGTRRAPAKLSSYTWCNASQTMECSGVSGD